MFARILIIVAAMPDETDWHARIARTWSAQGHAVRLWCPPAEAPETAFAAVADAFRPTLALWSAEKFADPAADALKESVRAACVTGVSVLGPIESELDHADFVMPVGGRCRAAVEKAIGALPANARPFVADMAAGADGAYLRCRASDPSATKDLIAVDRASTPHRRALVEAASAAAGLEAVSFHPGFNAGAQPLRAGADPSYWRRKTAFHIAFAGDDAISEAEAALRVAEGSMLFMECPNPENADRTELPLSAKGFRDADDLAASIGRLAHDAAAYEAVKARQAAALAKLGSLDDACGDVLKRLDANVGHAERTRILSQSDPAIKVVMYGWFGARNFGDDLLLTSTVARIRKRYPNAYFCAIGANASVLENEYGLQAATPDRKPVVRSFLESARAMVLCGGLLFDDPLAQTAGDLEFCLDPWIEPTGQAALCLLARSMGVPSVYLGFGAGPIDNRATRIAVNLIARSDALFLPRDSHTARLMEECGVPEHQVRVRADLVLGARDYVAEHAAARIDGIGDDPFFVVSLRRWHRNPASFARTVAKAIDATTRETGLTAVMLPFDQDDAALHREVVAHLENPASVKTIETRPDEAALLALVARSQFAFAMRLHCSILHHILDKPAVGLNYNDKIEAHFKRFGQEGLLMELDSESDAMARALHVAAHWNDDDRRALAERKADAERLVDLAFDELFEAIERPLPAPDGNDACFPRTVSNVEWNLREELDAATRRTHAADEARRRVEAENAALREEVAALRASKSFRIGNALMRGPHAVAARLGLRDR